MLWLTKLLWGMGKVAVLDSGFCVFQGTVELVKKGTFASAPIKKDDICQNTSLETQSFVTSKMVTLVMCQLGLVSLTTHAFICVA